MKRISDLPKPKGPCMNPGHYPPSMIVLPDGIYEHTCPGCGNVETVVVQNANTLGGSACLVTPL